MLKKLSTMNTVRCVKLYKNVSKSRRCFTTCIRLHKNNEISDSLRNIGVLAHIDAGKTTTTERMLFYSGTIRSMGEVHHGNTVTDYMEQERQRGITITAAAVSFEWKDHQFNLIDTPGHIDFTMEVEQSLGVLDGAVVVLDASAGVEAQTLTVWRQCDVHKLPRLVYVNKMDRQDANLNMCLGSLRNRFEVEPLCLQLPVRDGQNKLEGIVDIINLEAILWKIQYKGQRFTRRKLSEKEDGDLWAKAMSIRENLVDTLSARDDKLADIIIQCGSLEDVDSSLLKESVRRATLKLEAFPVLCGSSYKNIGVQCLMDGVVDYLPSPSERNQVYKCFESNLCAKAFKVLHDDQKGVLTFFRIFSGYISKAPKIYNISKQRSEQIATTAAKKLILLFNEMYKIKDVQTEGRVCMFQGGNLYLPYADEYKSVLGVERGNVAVVSGLKSTMTGDIITSSPSAASSAKKHLTEKLLKTKSRKELCLPPYLWNRIASNSEGEVDPEKAASFILRGGAIIPDPVFLCSIEPPSLAYQNSLEAALDELQREDPSLRVIHNAETGQTVLAGMGELHLDIIKARIESEYRIEVDLGPLQIAYKESLTSSARENHFSNNKIGSTKHSVNVTLSAYPAITGKELFRMDTTKDSASNLAHIYPKHLQAVKQGVQSSLLHGPKIGCPLINVGVTLHWLEVGRGTSETFIASTVSQCLRKVFENAGAVLLEPVMALEVICESRYLSTIMSDLTGRRTVIQNVGVRGNNKIIECLTPLVELLGYSTDLRCLSSGTATFTMEFYSNQQMSSMDEEKAIKNIQGF